MRSWVAVLLLIGAGIATVTGYASHPASSSVQTGQRAEPLYRVRTLSNGDIVAIHVNGRTATRAGYSRRPRRLLLLSRTSGSNVDLAPTLTRAPELRPQSPLADPASLLVSEAGRFGTGGPVDSFADPSVPGTVLSRIGPFPELGLLQIGPRTGRVWGYDGTDGPRTWSKMFPACSGRRQSPVNINTSQVRYQRMPEVDFFNFQPLADTFMFTNDGFTVRLIPRQVEHVTGLDTQGSTFTLAEIHFHWSSQHRQGSEHAINGVRFPMEMHVMTFATKYGSLDRARAKPDGFAVLAVIFDIGAENPAMWPIIASNSMLDSVGDAVPLAGLDLKELLPDNTSPYFRYRGSLTTPPCSENVLWTVCEHVQTMSQQQ
ncbi:hypothetical protein BaRGS_00036257, partial [Batillaria attramentaria]